MTVKDLGDGIRVSFDGENVLLSAKSYALADCIALNPSALQALLKFVDGMGAPQSSISIPLASAHTINAAFLPANPNRMRSAAPEVIAAAREFKRLLREARK